ncbi:hypothetical protein RCL_jg24201.t2 [Rhizophagus clarus]|uniref:Uncharacterized protein n=1 Tax=Rhizophagus clarus TaxID=94130 RepID=A0A8H3LG71_9GLOM|nr:hypothetical protein RCL_jg24201.t2 [Rhizophagus clarus]
MNNYWDEMMCSSKFPINERYVITNHVKQNSFYSLITFFFAFASCVNFVYLTNSMMSYNPIFAQGEFRQTTSVRQSTSHTHTEGKVKAKVSL